MKYEAILIDVDDTLLTFEAAGERALSQLFAELHMDKAVARLAYDPCNLACWAALERGEIDQRRLRYKRFEDFLLRMGSEEDPVKVSDRYTVLLSREGGLMPGALEAVRAIAREKPIAAVTNGITQIQEGRLAVSGLMPYLSAVVISEDVGCAKPDKRMIEAALSALGGIDQSRALMVGDSLSSDMTCARNAGVDACFFNPDGKPLPDDLPIAYVIGSLDELPAIANQ